MKNQRLPSYISIAFIVIAWVSQGLAFEKRMHQAVNEDIAKRTINGFSLDNYLIDHLGFKDGIQELLNSYSEMINQEITKETWKWLGEGGYMEDEPENPLRYPTNSARNNRHFHDPLENWDNAGLSTPIFTAQSSLVWAQNQYQDVGGKWSWHDAREYFYEGLSATGEAVKDSYFAKTFRALGQLMHLIQDASVPSHTRNDIHAIYHFESWVEDVRLNWSGKYNSWIAGPKTYDSSILDLPPNALAPIPIARIMDTDKYTRGNQDIESTKSSAIGIAEYSNGNFFSEDTCFAGRYPFPNWLCVETVPYQIVDPRDPLRTVSRQYYKKDITVACGETNGGKGYRLSTVGFLKDYVLKYYPTWVAYLRSRERTALDTNVYGDYASLLMPRAVGYSAGLLDYFFRGELQVTTIPILHNNAIDSLRVKIKNITSTQETMSDGIFTLSYRYTPTGGETDGSWDIWGKGPVVSSGTLIYDGEETVIDFNLSNPIHFENYTSAKFTLAFKGTLGNEEGAVIGKALTLGEIKFNEEWNNGLIGNHTWGHTDFNLFDQLGSGVSSNIIENDILVKDHIIHLNSKWPHTNDSIVSSRTGFEQFRDNLPIQITSDTYLEFKIDEMSIDQVPPDPPGEKSHWQYFIVRFTNGLNLMMTQEGQEVYLGDDNAYCFFPIGADYVYNIYELFKERGFVIPDGTMDIDLIGFTQVLWYPPGNVEYYQRMKIDYIRIVEGKKQ